ncbi:MAG: hypothetical protein DHS20C08_16180 [Rhodomicrobium sp.]|nr:MAG: hypothetical protein DHS20C08_16180 [Rhodomicrobium sp.]
MPIHQILEKIFIILIGWVFILGYKIISGLLSGIGNVIDKKIAKDESDRVFGKLNQDIEIYTPGKDSKNAD